MAQQAGSTSAVCKVTIPAGRRWRHIGWRILRSAVLIYVLVGLGMYALQTRLIFPGAASQGTADAQVVPPWGAQLVRLKGHDGTELVGLFGRPYGSGRVDEAMEPRPAVLFFYGNGMCMADTIGEFELFRRLGYNCMVIDYAGYGMSGGKPSEAGCYAAGEAAYQYVLGRAEVDRRRIVPAGWSLGGAVAIEVAHRHRGEGTVCGLIALSSFSSMVDVARHHYPFLPVGLVMTQRFEAAERMRQITVPYFAGHGRHDSIIPYENMGRLVAAYGGRREDVTEYTCQEADHNDFLDLAGRDLERGLRAFLEMVTARPAP